MSHSRQPSKTTIYHNLVAQTPVNDLSAGTRFPKPVETQSENPVAVSAERVNGWIENGQTEMTRSGTVVKKKKKKIIQQPQPQSEESSVVSSVAARTPSGGRAKQVAPSPLASSSAAPTPSKGSKAKKSTQHLIPPPPLPNQPRPLVPLVTEEEPASPPQLPPRKVKPKKIQTTTQAVQSVVAPPLTPPISVKSMSSKHRVEAEPDYSPPTSSEAFVPAPSRPRKSPKRKSFGEIILDDDQDIFYTPRTVAEPPSARSTMVEPPTSAMFLAPQVVFHPPTPAAVEETEESPFHSEQSSSISSSLHPQDGVSTSQMTPRAKRKSAQSPTPLSRQVNGHAQEQAEQMPDQDGGSDVGDIASDDEQDEERSELRRVSPSGSHRSASKHSRSEPGRSRPPSVSQSASSGNIHRPKSRGSVRESKTYDDFKMPNINRESYARSEASYGARSIHEGSVKSSGTSGYGKGGWAAAAASRSGSTTPVMFMPSGANDGWADFQPPPRQSKFTPLPAASQPQTFDKLVLGIPDNQTYDQQPEEGSYESSYDSSEDEDLDAPKPSRSYARQDGTPGSSNGGQTPPEQYQQQTNRRKPVPAGSEGGYSLGRSLSNEPEAIEWHEEALRRLSRISSPPPPLPLGLPGERVVIPARTSSVDDSSLSSTTSTSIVHAEV